MILPVTHLEVSNRTPFFLQRGREGVRGGEARRGGEMRGEGEVGGQGEER